tara:strand:- start:1202 stop:1492 length:291 start_codon:yes stop_codon:yes gene_type:complete
MNEHAAQGFACLFRLVPDHQPALGIKFRRRKNVSKNGKMSPEQGKVSPNQAKCFARVVQKRNRLLFHLTLAPTDLYLPRFTLRNERRGKEPIATEI